MSASSSSSEPSPKYVICVGAIYIDTILNVPHYPVEDQKLRAKKLTRRRGGNTGNTLEVLAQLVEDEPNPKVESYSESNNLHLIAVLPRKTADATEFIHDSLPGVNLENSCIFRGGHTEAASSYVIQNEQNLSRTIVSINELPEMTKDEFMTRMTQLPVADKHGWVHFEGRVPHVMLDCIQSLRRYQSYSGMKISVECEKPDRTGMAEVASYADVVFYSKLWAEHRGHTSASSFLKSQLSDTNPCALLCCTWGADGATAIQKGVNSETGESTREWVSVPAWHPDTAQPLVDTVGAGDTFIAGMLFALSRREDWNLKQKVQFANGVAGRKVLQDGFTGLGRKTWEI